MILDIDQ